MDEEKKQNGSDSFRYSSGGTTVVTSSRFLVGCICGLVLATSQLTAIYKDWRETAAIDSDQPANEEIVQSITGIRRGQDGLRGHLSSVQSRMGQIESAGRNMDREISENATQINRLKMEHGAGEP